MGSLELQQLTKVFDSDENPIVAVDELDISVQDGEFLVLVGPSGCGKSTTLRCIAGLETASSGTITLDDRDITNLKPKERGMSMVFQNYALYPHMSVSKNIGYGLSITSDLESNEIDRRVEETASMLEIEDLLEKRPGDLSGGQQQRVALGRAIIREPTVFLMDEPLSNLDAKLRTTMRTEIQQLHQNLGVTTIYVTHNQTEAMTMGDRIAILNDGELQQIGSPLECYHKPANRFVAGFIGSPSMNFFPVERDGDSLSHEFFTYNLSSSTSSGDLPHRLTLGVRPEHIQITDKHERNAIQSEVKVIEPMGEQTYLYVEVGDVTYTVSVTGSLDVEAGEEIFIMFPEDKVHLFDTETGTAIKNSDPDRATKQSPQA